MLISLYLSDSLNKTLEAKLIELISNELSDFGVTIGVDHNADLVITSLNSNSSLNTIFIGEKDKFIIDEANKNLFFVDLNWPMKVQLYQIRKGIEFFLAKKTLEKLDSELSQLGKQTGDDLQKIRNMHQVTVPIREQRFSNLSFFSKFSAGDNRGGDLFDILTLGDNLYAIVVSSNSYMITSAFSQLMHFMLSNRTSILSVSSVVNYFNKVTKELYDVEEFKLGFSVLRIDLQTLKGEVANVGGAVVLHNKSRIVSSGTDLRSFSKDDVREINLIAGDRVSILSEGGEKQWSNSMTKSLEQMLFPDEQFSSIEIINELFFQLKSSLGPVRFLSQDATLLLFEVNKNALSKV